MRRSDDAAGLADAPCIGLQSYRAGSSVDRLGQVEIASHCPQRYVARATGKAIGRTHRADCQHSRVDKFLVARAVTRDSGDGVGRVVEREIARALQIEIGGGDGGIGTCLREGTAVLSERDCGTGCGDTVCIPSEERAVLRYLTQLPSGGVIREIDVLGGRDGSQAHGSSDRIGTRQVDGTCGGPYAQAA